MARGGRRGLLSLLIPILSLLLEVAGVAVIVHGLFLLSPVVGFIGGGVGLILLAMALDPPRRAPKQIEAITE